MPGGYFPTIYVLVNLYSGLSFNLRPSWSQLDHFGHSNKHFYIAYSGNLKFSATHFFKYCQQKNSQNTNILPFFFFCILGIGLSFDLSHQTWRLTPFGQFHGVSKSFNWKKSKILLWPLEEYCWKFEMSTFWTILRLYSKFGLWSPSMYNFKG